MYQFMNETTLKVVQKAMLIIKDLGMHNYYQCYSTSMQLSGSAQYKLKFNVMQRMLTSSNNYANIIWVCIIIIIVLYESSVEVHNTF